MNILLITFLIAAFLFTYGRTRDKPLFLALSQILFFSLIIIDSGNNFPLASFVLLSVFFTAVLIQFPSLYNTILTLSMYPIILSLEIFSDMVNSDSFIGNNHVYVGFVSLVIISSLIGAQIYTLRSHISKLQIKILIIVNALVFIFGVLGFARL
jgi:hypothetical protein